ncbi:MAG TPA: hypothetical protein VGE09_06375 [Pseudoxanthomonas sp.]
MRRAVDPPSARARLQRYETARDRDDPMGVENLALRIDLGTHLQDAWKRGVWPNLRLPAARAMFAGMHS